MPPIVEKDMSFVDHLDELRKRLFRCVIAIFIFTIVAFLTMDVIFKKVILAPSKVDFITYKLLCKAGVFCVDKIEFLLQSRTLTGQFTMHLSASFVAGLVVSFPYVAWQIWLFLKPALKQKERSGAVGVVSMISFLFFLGVFFGYFVVSPLAINFLANYKLDEMIQNQFDVTSYVSLLSMMVVGCGIMFQLPVVVLILSKLGIMTPSFMRTYRKHAFVIILIIAAILTPSPDIFSINELPNVVTI